LLENRFNPTNSTITGDEREQNLLCGRPSRETAFATLTASFMFWPQLRLWRFPNHLVEPLYLTLYQRSTIVERGSHLIAIVEGFQVKASDFSSVVLSSSISLNKREVAAPLLALVSFF
jgi:hypothetical protein